MTRRSRFVVEGVACATLLWAGTVLAKITPQERCDSGRITAWKTYLSCVDTVVAKDAGCVPNRSCPVTFDELAAFAKCRHTYFKKWATLQTKTYAGSTCIGSRFVPTDSGATVTDGLTGLVWELKTNSGVHNGSDAYSWSTGSNAEDGTAFTTFLTTDLNTPGFAGANGWRLPTFAELQTILADFPCTAGESSPCIAFSDPNTQSDYYWSATSYVPTPDAVWSVDFYSGYIHSIYKTDPFYVRAVRGGLW